ncbi:MAG: 50S ribosomal protein L22 [Acidobacteriota bacterium]|nr:50S ribosomal protein L22 [Acidobacteriota bacterium]
MEAKAIGKYLRGSPQKARLVIDLIRGQKVGDALSMLELSRKRAAKSIEKVLRSAIANAEERSEDVDVEELFIKEAFVDMGPTKMRYRVRPAPMGRAFRERRHYKHITIRVSDGQSEEE